MSCIRELDLGNTRGSRHTSMTSSSKFQRNRCPNTSWNMQNRTPARPPPNGGSNPSRDRLISAVSSGVTPKGDTFWSRIPQSRLGFTWGTPLSDGSLTNTPALGASFDWGTGVRPKTSTRACASPVQSGSMATELLHQSAHRIPADTIPPDLLTFTFYE